MGNVRGKKSSVLPISRGTHLRVFVEGNEVRSFRRILGFLDDFEIDLGVALELERKVLWRVCGVGGVEGERGMVLGLFMI